METLALLLREVLQVIHNLNSKSARNLVMFHSNIHVVVSPVMSKMSQMNRRKSEYRAH